MIYFHSHLLSSSLVEGVGEAGADWMIAEYVQLTADPGQAESMMTALESAMKAEEEHEEMVRKVEPEVIRVSATKLFCFVKFLCI